MFAFFLCLTLALASISQPQEQASPVVIAAKKHAGGNAESVAISHDAKYVAAGFGGPGNGRFPLKPNGGGVIVWERDSGKQVFSMGEYGDVVRIGFSHDSRYLAYSRLYTPGDSIEANATVLIDLSLQKVIKRWSTGAFAFSPTHDLLIVSGRGETEVFDLSTMKVTRTVEVRGARAFAFSSDGKTVAALCYYWANNRGNPTGLAIFGPANHQPPQFISDPAIRSACAVVVSTDGKHVVTGHTGGKARIWITGAKAESRTLTVESALALFPFFLDKGKTLVLATQPANGVSWEYDRTDPSGFKFAPGKIPPGSDLHFFDFPDAKPKSHWRFEDASYRTYYARFGSGRDYPEYNPTRFDVSADGRILIAGCNGCCTVEATTGKLIRVFIRGK